MMPILVTGFDSFPGVKDNPSAALMAALDDEKPHFSRLDIRLETRVLSVVYEGLGDRVAALVQDVRPQAILHFGVATTREEISIETRARNRANLHTADANGAYPASHILDKRKPETISVRIPAAQIAAKIRAAGIAAKTSRDAGDYLCNALLFETLTSFEELPAGFIHIPRPRTEPITSSRPSFAEIVKATDIAIVAIAAHVRHIGARSAALTSS
jgi:pyroglutamyl-peptidase